MHLGIILTRFAEHIHNMTDRICLVFRPLVHNDSDLHPRTYRHFPAAVTILIKLIHLVDDILFNVDFLKISCLILRLCERLPSYLVTTIPALVRFCKRNRYVIWHETALHQHPCLIPDNMEHTYERLDRALKNLHDLSLSTRAVGLFTGHRHPYDITMQGAAGLGRFHEHIILFTLDYHKCKALSGHLHLSLHLREYLPFLPCATSCATVLLSCHKFLFFCIMDIFESKATFPKEKFVRCGYKIRKIGA